jgi:hypothetical protein
MKHTGVSLTNAGTCTTMRVKCRAPTWTAIKLESSDRRNCCIHDIIRSSREVVDLLLQTARNGNACAPTAIPAANILA